MVANYPNPDLGILCLGQPYFAKNESIATAWKNLYIIDSIFCGCQGRFMFLRRQTH